ncbi:hypothetical protein AURDEDRAFT_115800 [Auricularia subglabra TFB-10046 SS5]|nr:hypothetical protein AURDEDRAFT_115800 [Auricularia subglabra TFB-10046 SS5]
MLENSILETVYHRPFLHVVLHQARPTPRFPRRLGRCSQTRPRRRILRVQGPVGVCQPAGARHRDGPLGIETWPGSIGDSWTYDRARPVTAADLSCPRPGPWFVLPAGICSAVPAAVGSADSADRIVGITTPANPADRSLSCCVPIGVSRYLKQRKAPASSSSQEGPGWRFS